MTRRIFTAGICLFVLSFFLNTPSYGAEKIVMKVYLNAEDKGEYFVVMTPEKGVLIRLKDLLEMGFKDFPKGAEVRIGGEEYIPLHSMTPWALVEVDEKELVVKMTAEPQYLKKNVIDVSYRRPLGVTRSKENSAFVNYGLTYNVDDKFQFTSFTALTDVGLNIEDFLLQSNFSYTKLDKSDSFVRLLTSVTKDDIPAQRRYVLGDFFASSGVLGGGAYLGGFSVSKNFVMTPYFIKTAGLDLSGVLRTPSDVDILINDYPVKSERMSPGEFEFLNIYNAAGLGNATVVIKDAYGNVQKYTVPFYLSSSTLKAGFSEYSYNLGFKRKDLGLKSFKYDGAAMSFFHNYGFTKSFTAGIRAEADKDVINIGPSSAFLLGNYGEMKAAAALSGSDGRPGAGGTLSYSYAGKNISGFASVSGFSREYSNISIQALKNRTRLERTFNLGYNHEILGSLSGTFTRTGNYIGTGITRLSAMYARRLFRDISLHLIASRTKAETTVNEIFAGLTFQLGTSNFGGLSYHAQSGVDTETAYLQNAQPSGTGFGYRLLAERTKDPAGNPGMDGNGSVQYGGNYGTYSADYRRLGGVDSYSLNVAGGIAFIDRSFYFSRPITDSFALVKVGDVSGVKVSYTNQEAGVTDKNGEVLVPNLLSYQDNYIAIDDKDVPVNYSIAEVAKTVAPLNRSGVVVRFDTAKLQGFGGRIFVKEKGARVPAEYSRMEVDVEGKVMESVVGKGGEFYMENMPSGRFPARIFMKNRKCGFEIAIPKSNNTMVDMGEVTCEMD